MYESHGQELVERPNTMSRIKLHRSNDWLAWVANAITLLHLEPSTVFYCAHVPYRQACKHTVHHPNVYPPEYLSGQATSFSVMNGEVGGQEQLGRLLIHGLMCEACKYDAWYSVSCAACSNSSYMLILYDPWAIRCVLVSVFDDHEYCSSCCICR